MAKKLKIRTNFIKLSLTDQEYEHLVQYSEATSKTISGALREIIDLASDIGMLYGKAKEAYLEDRKKNEPNLIKAEETLLTIIKGLPFKAQMDFYAYLSKLDNLVPFSEDWKSVDK